MKGVSKRIKKSKTSPSSTINHRQKRGKKISKKKVVNKNVSNKKKVKKKAIKKIETKKRIPETKFSKVMKQELSLDKKFQTQKQNQSKNPLPKKSNKIHIKKHKEKKQGFFARLFSWGKPEKEEQQREINKPKLKRVISREKQPKDLQTNVHGNSAKKKVGERFRGRDKNEKTIPRAKSRIEVGTPERKQKLKQKENFSSMKQEIKLDKKFEKEFEKASSKAMTLSKKVLEDKTHKLHKDKKIIQRHKTREQQLSGKKEYVLTGITGFDSHFNKGEGIPAGASVLIEGGPGSGKTIFGLTTVNNLCKQGKKCLYMSFEEPEDQLISHMENFGFNAKEYIKKGLLRIHRFDAIDVSRSIEALLSAAKKELLIDVNPVFFPQDFQADFVVIDSLTSISSAFTGKENRFRIYMEQLFRYLERNEITSFLIREVSTPSHFGSNYKEDSSAVSFLSDGIVTLYNVVYSTGKRGGAIEILKLRGISFKKNIVEMEITKHGIEVYPNKIVSEDKGRKFRFT